MARLFTLLALLFLTATPSAACSVEKSYKVPTNFELVRDATLIVVARVRDAPSLEDASDHGLTPAVNLELIRVLKGSTPRTPLRLMGFNPPKQASGVPIATTLSQSHFSSGIGGCVRQFYEPGELVLAMFRPNPNAAELPGFDFIQSFSPFAREAETVEGLDDPWVHAVEKYIAIQSGPVDQVVERIRSAIAELRGTQTVEAQAMAEDLAYHLSRGERANLWSNFSTPMTTQAAVPGQQGVGLFCLAGTPPAIIVEGAAPTQVELVIGGKSFGTTPVPPSAIEGRLLNSRRGGLSGENAKGASSLFRLSNMAGVFSEARTATGEVAIKADGKSRVTGRPLDALFRWAGQCAKLQQVAAPTLEDLQK